MTQPSPEDRGLMWGGGLAEGWGPAMGTVPARQPGEHELRELVSQEEGMRRTLGWHPDGEQDQAGETSPQGGGHSWTWGPRLSWDHRALAGGECWSGPR